MPSGTHKMKFLVIGAGSIGTRHIMNLGAIGKHQVIAFDIDQDRLVAVSTKYKIDTFQDFDRALAQKPDAVLICIPNSLHLQYALKAAKAGCHLFMEKPLSHNLDGVDELLKIINKNDLKFLLGGNWKFHPSFKLMKRLLAEKKIGRVLSFSVISGQYLPDWHPQEDYRNSYSANQSLGGGVLLDSHEFYYLQWFLGSIKDVFCLYGKYSSLQIDTEDLAIAIVKTANNALGTVHLDYFQHPYGRSYQFYGESGTLEWSYLDKQVKLYTKSSTRWDVYEEEKDYDLNQMYVDEMQHFISVIEGKDQPKTDIFDAKHVLELIEKIKRKSTEMPILK